MNKLIRTWLVPGAVFQSVTIGGGYGTGREVVEFISKAGPLGGVVACLLIALALGVLLGMSFDFARRFEVRDYRLFVQELLGPLWILYECIMVTGLVVILAICGAAAGEVIEDSLGWPAMVGIGLMLLVIVMLAYLGRTWIEKTLTLWSVLVTLSILAYATAVFNTEWENITTTVANSDLGNDWWGTALRFAAYNCVVAPTLLYATQDIGTRTEAWGAGMIAGFLAAIPALLYHLSFMSVYPEVLDEPLPTYLVLQGLHIPIIVGIYLILLFGAIAQTGAGILQGINERWDNWWLERFQRPLKPRNHAMISGVAVISSLILADVGIIGLVAKAYGAMAWVSLCLFVIPLFTIGAWKMYRQSTHPEPALD